MKEIHRLIYRKEIFYYSCEFVPQILQYSTMVQIAYVYRAFDIRPRKTPVG